MRTILLLLAMCAYATCSLDWTNWGNGIDNNRFADDSQITPSNVNSLIPMWTKTMDGDVSSTPTVKQIGGVTYVFVSDWTGKVYSLDAFNGYQFWKVDISDYTGIKNAPIGSVQYANGIFQSVSRNSPAYTKVGNKHVLVLGDQASGKLLGLDALTGALLWITTLDDHPTAFITMSPTIYEDHVYVGVSSSESGYVAINATYPCCSFAGSFHKVHARTGVKVWKWQSIHPSLRTGPPSEQYSGAALWGSSPSIDKKRGLVFAGTGQNYNYPTHVKNCIRQSRLNGSNEVLCLDERNYFDSFIALRISDGSLAWHKKLNNQSDYFNAACVFGAPACPPADIRGPDYDLGQAPMLYKRDGKKYAAAGAKSGIFWALNPKNGNLRWWSNTGPGSASGGVMWGSATNGKFIYTTNTNSGSKTYTLKNGQNTTLGIWSCMYASTGKFKWQITDPTGTSTPRSGHSSSSVTLTKGKVLFVGAEGALFGLDARNGDVKWRYNVTGTVITGPSVVGRYVYWGTGYGRYFGMGGNPGRTFYAFRRP